MKIKDYVEINPDEQVTILCGNGKNIITEFTGYLRDVPPPLTK